MNKYGTGLFERQHYDGWPAEPIGVEREQLGWQYG